MNHSKEAMTEKPLYLAMCIVPAFVADLVVGEYYLVEHHRANELEVVVQAWHLHSEDLVSINFNSCGPNFCASQTLVDKAKKSDPRLTVSMSRFELISLPAQLVVAFGRAVERVRLGEKK